MKINSKQSTKLELIVMAAVLFFKSLLVHPFYKKLFGFAESADFTKAEILVALSSVILAVAVVFLFAKSASDIGDGAKLLLILAVAEPMLIATLGGVFQVIAVIAALVCVTVCIKIENRILPAILTVAVSALISFIMPCSVFTFVLLVVLVLFITSPKGAASRIVSLAGAALSVAATVICVQLSDPQLRAYFKVYSAFDEFGGSESHALNFDRLGHITFNSFISNLQGVALASLPVILLVIFIAVKTICFKDKKNSSIPGKILTLAALVVPYAAAIFAIVFCMGRGFATGFNIIPLAVILAFAAKGNRYVRKSLDDACSLAKAHPIAAIIAIIWLASYSAAFAADNTVYSLATQFAM